MWRRRRGRRWHQQCGAGQKKDKEVRHGTAHHWAACSPGGIRSRNLTTAATTLFRLGMWCVDPALDEHACAKHLPLLPCKRRCSAGHKQRSCSNVPNYSTWLYRCYELGEHCTVSSTTNGIRRLARSRPLLVHSTMHARAGGSRATIGTARLRGDGGGSSARLSAGCRGVAGPNPAALAFASDWLLRACFDGGSSSVVLTVRPVLPKDVDRI